MDDAREDDSNKRRASQPHSDERPQKLSKEQIAGEVSGDKRNSFGSAASGLGPQASRPPEKTKNKNLSRGQAKFPQRAIEPNWSGIWATCTRGKEKKSVADLKLLFEEHAAELYGDVPGSQPSGGELGGEPDVESELERELAEIRRPAADSPFTYIDVGTDCVLFFRTRPPIEPVSFVHAICTDAARKPERKQGRFVKRLTPITLIGNASEVGLERVARKVLAPHFHAPGGESKKFAIQVNSRNHSTLSREVIFRTVASAVGPGHRVDLKGYDLLILVEIHKEKVGMSVVGPEYEALRRFNLDEISKLSAPKSRKGEC